MTLIPNHMPNRPPKSDTKAMKVISGICLTNIWVLLYIIKRTVSWRLTHSLSDDFVLCEANTCVGEEKGNAMTDQLESSNRQAMTSVGA